MYRSEKYRHVSQTRRSARIHVLMRKRILASPPPQCCAPDTFCKAEAGSQGVLGEGRTRPNQCGVPVGAHCHASPSAGPANLRRSAEPGSTRCSTRASERCAMFDSWQIMSIWNMRCAPSQQRASHVSTTTRVCGLGAPDIAFARCHKFEKLQRETRIVRGFVVLHPK